jgi:AraC-like DNA-binding protein
MELSDVGAQMEPLRRSGSYQVLQGDTGKEPGDPTGYWVEHVRANQGSLCFRFADAAAFRGGTIVQRSPEYQLVDCWSESLAYSKTDADVRADDQRGCLLIVAREGVLDIEQRGDQIRLQPGQGVLLSKSRSYQFRHDSWARGWTFDVQESHGYDAHERCPVVIDLRRGLGSVVGAMISTVGVQRRGLDSYEFTRSCATISDLLRACMLDRRGGPGTLESVERAVREYVARNACNPDLTPSNVACSLGWSVRQIQVALQRAGTTPADLIRSTRVVRAADLLRQSPDVPISSIACASGFRSMTTFNAVFKKHFELSPREVRALRRLS